MILDPVTTFFVYVGSIAALFTVAAFIADTWGARIEREARYQARLERRAKLREEMEASGLLPPFSSSQSQE